MNQGAVNCRDGRARGDSWYCSDVTEGRRLLTAGWPCEASEFAFSRFEAEVERWQAVWTRADLLRIEVQIGSKRSQRRGVSNNSVVIAAHAIAMLIGNQRGVWVAGVKWRRRRRGRITCCWRHQCREPTVAAVSQWGKPYLAPCQLVVVGVVPSSISVWPPREFGLATRNTWCPEPQLIAPNPCAGVNPAIGATRVNGALHVV